MFRSDLSISKPRVLQNVDGNSKTLLVNNMKRHFLAPAPRFGRVNNRLPVGYQQRSPYYWWWQYLRRNADYIACCERGGKGRLSKLYKDFGDVREDNFHKWWTEGDRGVELFAEQPLAVRLSELHSAAEWKKDWTAEKVLVVVVPLNVSKRGIKGAFNKLLEARHSGSKSGRPSLSKLKEHSTARYVIENNYTISSLSTMLSVYDEWLANTRRAKTEQLTLWEIGAKLNLNKSAIKDAVSTSTADRHMGRNSLAASVGRYVRQAKSVIANTTLGQFPLMAVVSNDKE